MRILLVEDNMLNALALKRMLLRQGHEVTHAENGNQALTHFTSEDYDMVLMDLMMPGMDGFETTQRIRDLEEKHSRTPIVAVTALMASQAQDRCLEAGMNFFLTKPVDEHRFREVADRFAPDSPARPA